VLSKEPAARYRTADQLGRVLVTFSEQKTIGESGSDTTTSAAVTQNYPRSIEARPVQVDQLPPPSLSGQNVNAPQQYQPYSRSQNPLSLDWLTIGLALLALIAVLGLVPFFLWVYLQYQ
jgi:serine/threonine-protein kinase